MKIDFRKIIPYMKRMSKPRYNMGNLETHEIDRLKFVADDVIGEMVTGECDVLFITGFPKDFLKYYDNLIDGGSVFFFTSGKDIIHKGILQWRISNKHSPEIMVIKEDNIWFWKKPTSLVEKLEVPSKQKENAIWPETPKEENHLNQALLNKYAKKDEVFIETGTYLGQGIIAASKYGFKEINTIELHEGLHSRAEEKYSDIATIHLGDSPMKIEEILKDRDKPKCFFWLDAHASGPLPGGVSGGTPVLDELRMIKKYASPISTIVIDDCRLFGDPEWSFVEKEDAINLIKEINPDYKIEYEPGEVENDVLVAYVE